MFLDKFLEQSSWTNFLNKVLEQKSWTKFSNKVLEHSSWTKFLDKVFPQNFSKNVDQNWVKLLSKVLKQSSWKSKRQFYTLANYFVVKEGFTNFIWHIIKSHSSKSSLSSYATSNPLQRRKETTLSTILHQIS